MGHQEAIFILHFNYIIINNILIITHVNNETFQPLRNLPKWMMASVDFNVTVFVSKSHKFEVGTNKQHLLKSKKIIVMR